jgi:hypothetical protein
MELIPAGDEPFQRLTVVLFAEYLACETLEMGSENRSIQILSPLLEAAGEAGRPRPSAPPQHPQGLARRSRSPFVHRTGDNPLSSSPNGWRLSNEK